MKERGFLSRLILRHRLRLALRRMTERLGAAAANGQAAGKAPAPEPKGKEPPELERTITKVLPFEMGI